MYAAEFRTSRLTFELAGVWRRNLVLRDRETGTLWQQETGHALVGPLEGARLQPLPGVQTTYAAWLGEHPGSTVVVERGHRQGLLPERLAPAAFDRLGPLWYRTGLTSGDARLPQNAHVVGVVVDRSAVACPLGRLQETGIIHHFAAGRALTFIYMAETDRVVALERPYARLELALDEGELVEASTYDGNRPPHRWSVDGQPRTENAPRLPLHPHHRLTWSGWYEFHPETAIVSNPAA